MSKRDLVPILRQSLLLCRDPLQRFVLLHTPSNAYSLPIFHSSVGESFRQGLKRGMSELSIEAKIKGIIRMEAGRIAEGRFYRCIYYATESSMISPNVVFKTYEELSSIQLSSYDRSLLEEVYRAPKVYSMDFFREYHHERAPMDAGRKTMVEV